MTRLFGGAAMQSAATPISVCSENCLTLACLQLNFAVNSMALGYAASSVHQTAVLFLQATTFLVLAATGATAGSSALSSYFGCCVEIVLFRYTLGKGFY